MPDAMLTTLRSVEPVAADDRHVLSVLVENHYGVLSRVSGMFAARGFNIDTLTVCETEDPTMSRMTMSVIGRTVVVDQIRKQLEKLPEVIVIDDFTELGPFVERELALIKLRPHGMEERSNLLRVSMHFDAKSVDATPDTVTFELVGQAEQITHFLAMATKDAEVVEIARSGVVALGRGRVGQRERFLEEAIGCG